MTNKTMIDEHFNNIEPDEVAEKICEISNEMIEADNEIILLKKQVEAMKCCGNCVHVAANGKDCMLDDTTCFCFEDMSSYEFDTSLLNNANDRPINDVVKIMIRNK